MRRGGWMLGVTLTGGNLRERRGRRTSGAYHMGRGQTVFFCFLEGFSLGGVLFVGIGSIVVVVVVVVILIILGMVLVALREVRFTGDERERRDIRNHRPPVRGGMVSKEEREEAGEDGPRAGESC